MQQGSLYPALQRMLRKGWIRSEWAVTDSKRRARVYSLTPEGRRQLEAEEESWKRLTDGVNRVLSFV